jgi:hypothetical protein
MVGRGASLDGRLILGGTDGSNPVPSSGESVSPVDSTGWHRHIIVVPGEPRQLTLTSWHLFTLLYRRRGTVVSSKALLRRQRENLRQLRRC